MALGPFDNLISSTINAIGVPSGLLPGDFLALINAVIKKESTFNPSAISPSREGYGLMQVNPNYWLRVFNVELNELLDPATNIQIGATILRDYINDYGLYGGIGSYRAGPNQRFNTIAQQYTNTVIGYWNNFKNLLRSVYQQRPATPGQFYFVEPEQGLAVSPDIEYISLDNASFYPSVSGEGFDWTITLLIFFGFYLFSEL